MTGKSRENKNLQTSQKEWKLLIVNNFHYYPTLFHVGIADEISNIKFIEDFDKIVNFMLAMSHA